MSGDIPDASPIAQMQGNRVHELFERWAREVPQALAVVAEDCEVSYEELNRQANRLAWYLKEQGVGPDVRVVVCLERGVQQIQALLAVLKAGGAYVPVEPGSPSERVGWVLQSSRPRLVISTSQAWQQLRSSAPQLPVLELDRAEQTLRQQRQDDMGDADVQGSPGDLAYVLYTSGSTGRPKGVMVEHQSVAGQIQALLACYGLQQDERVLQFASATFDMSVEEIFTALGSGATLVLRTDDWLAGAQRFWAQCEKARITHLNLPSSFWQQLVLAQEQEIPVAIRRISVGGEAMPEAFVEKWFQAQRKPRLYNAYGPTEATVNATVQEVTSQRGTWRSIGRPLAGVQVHILDAACRPMGVNAVGEIYIAGEGVARGYLEQPVLTAQRFVADPFGPVGRRMYRTGDMGRRNADGAIEYLGRNDHQVKIRGYRIELGEIEAALLRHPAVEAAVVVYREAPGIGASLVGYVACPGDGRDTKESALRSHLGSMLPDYMMPRRIAIMDALPINANGKIDRRALPIVGLATVVAEYTAPRNSIETEIAKAWATALGREQVGVFDNFFDLGGHSLLATQLIWNIQQRLGVDLPLRALFEAPDVASLASKVQLLLERAKLQDVVDINFGIDSPLPSAALVQSGNPGEVLFCTPSIGGGVPAEYRQLGTALAFSPAIYCFTACDFKTRRLPEAMTLNQLCATYVQELLQAYPDGPYRLCGYSTGGVLAFEMARQLSAYGKVVELVAMIDTQVEHSSDYPPHCSSEERRSWHDFFGLLGRQMVREIVANGDAPFWNMTEEERLTLVMRVALDSGQAPTGIGQEDLRYLLEVSRRMVRMCRAHVPGNYIGDVSYFVQYSAEDNCNVDEPARTIGYWRAKTQGAFQVFEVGGNHQTMMTSPYVDVIAERIAGAFAACRSN